MKYYIFCRNCFSKLNLLDCVSVYNLQLEPERVLSAHKQKNFKLYLSSYHNWMMKDECKSGKYDWYYFSGNEGSKGEKCITIHFFFLTESSQHEKNISPGPACV